jgi:hypothetical protein
MPDNANNFPSAEELRARGIRNMLPDLPISPCVKHKVNGRIYAWSRIWAMRPDVFVNCDENGEEDPSFWSGRGPGSSGPVQAPPLAVPVQAPPPPGSDGVIRGTLE